MWIEQQPKFGDTVKVEYSNWYAEATGKNVCIGIYLHANGRHKVDVGDRMEYFWPETTFYVYVK